MWSYKGKPFNIDDIGDNYGFVYIITNKVSGKRYVGRKYFWSKRTLPPLKGQTRKRHRTLPSDWKTYWSSSAKLLEDVQQYGEDSFVREIVSLHRDKTSTNYHELTLQIHLNVLEAEDDNGEPLFYNDNILAKFYRSAKYHDERNMLHEEYRDFK